MMPKDVKRFCRVVNVTLILSLVSGDAWTSDSGSFSNIYHHAECRGELGHCVGSIDALLKVIKENCPKNVMENVTEILKEFPKVQSVFNDIDYGKFTATFTALNRVASDAKRCKESLPGCEQIKENIRKTFVDCWRKVKQQQKI